MGPVSDALRLARTRGAAGKPALRQWAEMAWLWASRGVGPNMYQAGGFWARDRDLAELSAYLTAAEYRAFVAAMNPVAYRKISQHKLPEKALLELFGIPTARFLGLLHAETGRARDGAPLTSATDLARAATGWPAAIVMKLVEGHGGVGFTALDLVPGGFRDRRDGTPLDPAQLWDRLARGGGGRPYIVEALLPQHPFYAALHPASVNTYRVWAARRGAATHIYLAYLRIGRGGSLIDNREAGGLVAPVDLAHGTLRAAVDGKPPRNEHTHHPDTGAAIAGTRPPFLAEALALTQRTLLAFPGHRFIGSDVAITPDGPAIIEVNMTPGREGAIWVGKPTRGLLDLV